MLQTFAIFSLLLLLALLIEPLADRLKLPFSSFLVVMGFIGSEAIVLMGFDTGLRWNDFVDIILHVLVPIIIFESAFNANFKALMSNIGTILYLAIPAMMLASASTGVILYLGINNSTYFPLTSALLAGVILSATDPVAVVAIFKKLGAPARLNALLEGESLFNDATAIVIFTLLVALSVNPLETVSAGSAIGFFIKNFIGGIITGTLIAISTKQLYRLINTPFTHTLLGISTAIIAFYIAEKIIHVSGVVAVLSAGLLLGDVYRNAESADNNFAETFWELNVYIANAILFILVGVTITTSMFTDQWYAILLGITAATIVRAMVIYALLPLFTLLPFSEKTNYHYKNVLMWGGLRGAVSLALALSLPTSIEGWYTIQSIVYGVVVFTLFVQAPFIDKLVIRTLK